MANDTSPDVNLHMKERLYEMRELIDNHIQEIHTSLTNSAKKTIKFIQTMQKSTKSRQRPISSDIIKLDPALFTVRRLWDQVAMEKESPDTSDFDVVFSSQSKHQKIKKIELKKEEKKKPRLTKGEAEEIFSGLRKSDQERVSRIDDQFKAPSSMAKLFMVNAKMDRFKRKIKPPKKYGKMVNHRLHTILF